MESTEQRLVSLANLKRGGVIERFDDALGEVLGNVLDPNTTTNQRKITLEITFKPDEERETMDVGINCKTALAGPLPMSTRLYIGKVKGRAVATELDPRQALLPGMDESAEEPAKSNITQLHSAGGKQ